MMATTHALYGMLAGLAVATVAPELAPTAMLAGFVGGFAPDLDAYADHRRTLHAPVYGSVFAVAGILLAVLAPAPIAVALASAALGAALHAVMDVTGGGLSLEPWAETPNRAVYSHFHGRWLRPRQWVRYDGSPEDLVLALVAGVPLLVVTSGSMRLLVGGAVGLSVGYVLVRRRLVDLLLLVLAHTPDRLRPLVPRRIEDARK